MRTPYIALALLAATASGATQAAVVWHHGFGQGLVGYDWSDVSSGQNLADSVSFAQAATITGYTFYGATDLSAQTGSSAFHLKLLGDQVADPYGQPQHEPGQPLMSEDIGYSGSAQVCAGCVPGGYDAFSLSFTFAPIRLAANTRYWIGLSGNGFDADALSLLGVQDGSMAQFDGAQFAFIASGANGEFAVGNLMFQLTGTMGTVAEPATMAMMMAGLAAGGLAGWRRRR